MAIALIYFGAASLLGETSEPIAFAQDRIAAAAALFLPAGPWTPVIGTLVALDEVWIALSLYSSQRGVKWLHVLLAVLWSSLAMVSPGLGRLMLTSSGGSA